MEPVTGGFSTPEGAGNRTRLPVYTPRTPAIRERRQRFSLRPMHTLLEGQPAETDSDLDDALDKLTKQTWIIWGVSALYGFQYKSEVKLKQYAKRLREEVASALAQEDVTYETTFSVQEHLAPSPMDTPAICVEVKAISEDIDKEKLIYQGIFLSWRATGGTDISQQWVKLPVLLCRGNQTGIKTVHSILCRMFDCTILGLPVSCDDLMWLVPILLNPGGKKTRDRKGSEVVMEYRIPGLPKTDSITFSFPFSNVQTLWNKVCQKEEEADDDEIEFLIEGEDVDLFHECLKNQAFTVSGLRLGLCMLHKISLPSMTISGNRMKVMNIEAMDRILLFLQEKACELFQSLDSSPREQ